MRTNSLLSSTFLAGVLVSSAMASQHSGGKRAGGHQAPIPNIKTNASKGPALRRARQVPSSGKSGNVSKVKVGDRPHGDAAQRKLAAIDLDVPNAVNSLLNVPRDILGSVVPAVLPFGGGLLNGAGFGGSPNAPMNQLFGMQNNLGGFVDKTRGVADTGFDTMEQIVSGLASKGRGVLDRAASRAAEVVENSVALGGNSLGATLNTARGVQGEAKRIAGQAAGAAQNALRTGEGAVVGVLDRLVDTVGPATSGALFLQGGDLSSPSLLSKPLSAITNIASNLAI